MISPGGRALLARSLRGRRRQLVGLAAWSLVQAGPAFLSGRLLARAIDQGFLVQRPATGFAWLGVLAGSVVVGAWGARQTFLRLAAVVEPFRDELIEIVVTGALHRATRWGRATDDGGVARLTHHVEILREAYAGVLMTVQGFAVTAAGAVLGLASLVPAAALFVVPPLLIGLVVFAAALGPLAARQREAILADEAIAAGAGALEAGYRDVVACGGEAAVEAAVGGAIDVQERATRALARATATRTIAIAVGGWLPLVLLLVGGPWLLDRGATTGQLLGALTYVLYGVQPALQTLVRELGGSGLWLFVTLDRLVEATNGSSSDAPTPAVPSGVVPGRFDLYLDGVTFRYGAAAAPVVDNLDLVIPEGDHLAVVGPSGAGKSTLAALLAGILRPEAGTVRLGGVPVHDLASDVLAEARVLIPQEAYVFAGTLGENLTYLRPDAGPEEVARVVGLLGAGPLVERLGGCDAVIDPSGLSSGERQLVTLVRSFLSPAPVVVLDEATCHLDPAAEAVVERAFAARPGTLVVIAHRVSSALRARRTLVLDGGRAAVGTHDELVAASPLYRDLTGLWV